MPHPSLEDRPRLEGSVGVARSSMAEGQEIKCFEAGCAVPQTGAGSEVSQLWEALPVVGVGTHESSHRQRIEFFHIGIIIRVKAAQSCVNKSRPPAP